VHAYIKHQPHCANKKNCLNSEVRVFVWFTSARGGDDDDDGAERRQEEAQQDDALQLPPHNCPVATSACCEPASERR